VSDELQTMCVSVLVVSENSESESNVDYDKKLMTVQAAVGGGFLFVIATVALACIKRRKPPRSKRIIVVDRVGLIHEAPFLSKVDM